MKQFSTKLEYLRQNKGWSQENVAAELGISQSSYVRLIKNPECISLSRLTQLAKLYQINTCELLKDLENEMDRAENQNVLDEELKTQNDDEQ
jgi:transcriptional regulator with XRE-family HTH domain